jgi:Ca2+-binding RTX toxin-like protein
MGQRDTPGSRYLPRDEMHRTATEDLNPSLASPGGAQIESQSVMSDLTVSAGQTLTFVATQQYDVGLSISAANYHNNSGPSLYNFGTIQASSGFASDDYWAIAVAYDSLYHGATIENHGIINVSGTASSRAHAIFGYFSLPFINNTASGQIVVQAGDAIGVTSFDPYTPINNDGLIRINATARMGIAVAFDNINHAPLTNSGTIEVHLSDAAWGGAVVWGEDSGFTVINSGHMSVTADANSQETVAIRIFYPDCFQPTTIVNSGDISASWSIFEDDTLNLPSAAETFVENRGTIEGMIFLNSGSDTIVNPGTITGDVLLGSDTDTYKGAGGHVVGFVHGGDDNDMLVAGNIGDNLAGDAGDDTLVGGSGNDLFDGGDGADTVDYNAAQSGVALSLANSSPQNVGGNQGLDTLVSIENLAGSEQNDILSGSDADNVLTGAGGADALAGGAGNDKLYGDWARGLVIKHLEVVSSDIYGTPGNDTTFFPTISSDFSKVLFTSRAENLAPTSSASGVYLKDVATGAVTAIAGGFQSVISGDGTRMGFTSSDSAVPGDTNGFDDVFVRDFATGTNQLVTQGILGAQSNGASKFLDLSANGSRVLFFSDATNLVPDDHTNATEIFVKDLASGVVTLVSSSASGVAGEYGSYRALLSDDGTKVLFISSAGNLVGGDANNWNDLFVKDLASGAITLVSRTTSGGQAAPGEDFQAFALSPDGTKVAFASASSHFMPGDTENDCDIFLKDLDTGQLILLSASAAGTPGNDGSFSPVFSADGRHVAFFSYATNLAPGGTPGMPAIFIKDIASGGIQRLELPEGMQGTAHSNTLLEPEYPGLVFSADGSKLMLLTGAGGYLNQVCIADLAQPNNDGNDVLSGDAGDDVIDPGSGNDIIKGGDGNDMIVMGANLTSVDQIDGGTETDTVTLDGDYPSLTFSATTLRNVERLQLTLGHSYALTTDNATVGVGQSFAVDASSLSATNVLSFDGSAETDGQFNIIGGAGNDTIRLGSGVDKVAGGGGNDLIAFTGGFRATDAVDGGSGIDTLLLAGTYSGGVTMGSATLLNMEKIVLGAGFSYLLTTDDTTVAGTQTLSVDASALGAMDHVTVRGGAETDGKFVFVGGAGNDSFTGGAGADSFDLSRGGDDFAVGGAGDDIVTLGADFTRTDRIDGGVGFDAVLVTGTTDVAMTSTTLANIEKIVLGRGFSYSFVTVDTTVAAGTTLTVDGSSLANTDTLVFKGKSESDGHFTVTGGRGADAIYGGTQDDVLDGGIGDDTLDASAGGNDLLSGGKGNDTIRMGASFTALDVIDGGGSARDRLELDGDYGGGVMLGSMTLRNVGYIKVAGGHSYSLTGNNAMLNSGATMTVDGTSLQSGESLMFDASAETDGSLALLGGGGADTLAGGAGSDMIAGGGGADLLAGGAGQDTFRYKHSSDSSGVAYDTITDFDFALDRIHTAKAVHGVDRAVTTGSLSLATFDADLAAALDIKHLGKLHAVLLTADSGDLAGQTFLVIDRSGGAGYQAGQDIVIHLVGAINSASFGLSDFV